MKIENRYCPCCKKVTPHVVREPDKLENFIENVALCAITAGAALFFPTEKNVTTYTCDICDNVRREVE